MSIDTLAPVSGKTVALDPALSSEDLARLQTRLTLLGATLVLPDQRADLRILAPHTMPALTLHYPSETLIPVAQADSYLVPDRNALVRLIRTSGWRSLQPLDAAGIELDLTGADLGGLDLTGLYLAHARLKDVNVHDAVLDDAYLHRPKGIDFRGVQSLARATFYSPENCNFAGMDLTSSRVQGRPDRCSFEQSKVQPELLRECSPHRCDFSGVDFQRADLNHWTTSQVILRGANLHGADLRYADLRDADLTGANVSGTDFTGAIVRGVNWTDVATPSAIGIVMAPSSIVESNDWGESSVPHGLIKALADISRWYLRIQLALVGGEAVTITLGRHDNSFHLSPGDGDDSRRCSSLADLFRFPSSFRRATPILETLMIRPMHLERTGRPVLLRALHVALGVYTPGDHAQNLAHRERLHAAGSQRREAILKLRQGIEGLEEWNLAYEKRPSVLRALRQVHLAGCQLPGINLREARAAEGNFAGANLSGALMRGARLTRANFRKADLTRADLHHTLLERANLASATLRFADLSQSNLGEANLHDADLTGVRLDDARLQGADLRGARFDFVSLDTARYDSTTRFPAGFHPQRVLKNPANATDMHRALLRKGVPINRLRIATEAYLADCRPRHVECGLQQVAALIPNADEMETHACRLTWQGHHECVTPRLDRCREANQGLCSHLLLLLLALPGTGVGPCGYILPWLEKARAQRPKSNEGEMASILLRDEIHLGSDYRPSEMLPEDYYAQ